MPSDALAQNLGRLNNSIEKLFPLLNAVATNSNAQNKSDAKGSQKLDKAVKAMSSGVFMSIIIDNASSKELVKASDSMKNLIGSAGSIDKNAIESFKNNIVSLTNAINSVSSGNAKAISNLNNYSIAIKRFVQITNSLSKLSKINSKKLNEISSIDFTKIVKELNSLTKIKPESTAAVATLNNIVNSLSNLNKIDVKKVDKLFKDLSALDFTNIINNFSQLNKITPNTKKGLDEFIKLVSSLDELDKINVNKSIKKLNRLFRGLNNITSSLIIYSDKKVNIVELSGLADFINAAKVAEKINTKRANRKIQNLRSFFENLNDITKNIILAPDSPFANATKRKQLTSVIKSINEFVDSNNALMKSMALNAVLGIPALIGFAFTKLIYSGLIKTLDKLSAAKISKNTTDAVRQLSLFALSMAGVVGILAVTAKVVESTNIGSILLTLGLFATVSLLSLQVGKIAKNIGQEEIQGVKSLGIFSLIMVGVTGSIILLSKIMENTSAGAVIGTVGLMAVVSLGLIGIGKLASTLQEGEIQGMKALGIMAALMVGVTASIVLIANAYAATDPGAIWATLGLMATTAVMLVGIGYATSALMTAGGPAAIAGASATGIMALIMVGTTIAIIKLSDDVNKAGFNNIMKTMGIMALIAAGLIGMGALLGVAVAVTAPGIIGALAIAAVAAAMVYAIKSLVDIHNIIQENKDVFELRNINGKQQLAIMGTLTPVVKGILELGDTIGETSLKSYIKTTFTLGLVNKLLKTIGRMIDVLIKFDKTGLTEDRAIEIASTTTKGILTFLNVAYSTIERSEGLSNKSIRKARKTFRLVNNLLNTIGNMINMITKFDKAELTEDKVESIANITINNILKFITVVYSTLEKSESLSNKAIRKARRTFRLTNNLISSINNMIDMIVKFEKTELTEDKVNRIAIITIHGILTFMNVVYNTMNRAEGVSNRAIRKTRKTFNTLNQLLGSVNKMIDVISKFEKAELTEEKVNKITVNMCNGLSVFIDTILHTMTNVEDVSNKTVKRTKKTLNLINVLLKSANSIIDLLVKFEKTELTEERATQLSNNIGNGIMIFVNTILLVMNNIENTSNKAIRKTRTTFDLLDQLLNSTTMMVDLFDKFNKIGLSEEDATRISNNIGGGIQIFIDTTLNTMTNVENTSNKAIRKTRRTFELVQQLLNVTDNFLEIISKYSVDGRNIIETAKTSGDSISKALLSFTNNFFNGFDGENGLEIKSKKESKRVKNTLKNLELLVGVVPEFLTTVEHAANLSKSNIDLVATAQTVANSVQLFVSTIFNSFDEASDPKKIKKQINNFSRIVKPVVTFVDMITGLSAKDGKLGKINYDENGNQIGNITYVDVVSVSGIIANAVSKFLTTLYSIENVNQWKNISGSTSNKVGKLLSVIDPINKFVNLLSKYDIKDGNLAVYDHYNLDANGNPKLIKKFNIGGVAESISSAVVTFLNILYDKKNIDEWKSISGSSTKKIGKLLQVIDPINSFMNILSKYDFKDGNLAIYDYNNLDANGNPKLIKTYDATLVATNIFNSISGFMTTFYSDANMKVWDSISGRSISKVNRKIGKLTQIIDPISSFVDMLSMWNSSTELSVIDPATGKVSKTVAISDVAGNIAKAVTTFMNGIYSHENEWDSASGIESEGKPGVIKQVGKAIANGINDIRVNRRLGKFAKIIDPINAFMALVTSYTWDGKSLKVLNGDGTTTSVNFAETGSNIAAGISAFSNSIYDSKGNIKGSTTTIVELGKDFEDSFKKIDETLKKGKNDERIKELKRLTEEFKKLSENINSVVKSTGNVTSALSNLDVSNVSVSSSSNNTRNRNENNNSSSSSNASSTIDYNKLSTTLTNAVNSGIAKAFKDKFTFEGDFNVSGTNKNPVIKIIGSPKK